MIEVFQKEKSKDKPEDLPMEQNKEDISNSTEPEVIRKDPVKPEEKEKEILSVAYVKLDVKPNTVSQGPNGNSPDIDIDKTKSESDKEDEDKDIGPKKAQKDDILNNNVTEPESNKNMEKPKSAENLDEDLKNTNKDKDMEIMAKDEQAKYIEKQKDTEKRRTLTLKIM